MRIEHVKELLERLKENKNYSPKGIVREIYTFIIFIYMFIRIYLG